MSDDDSGHSDRRAHPRAQMVLKVEYPSREGFLQDYTVNISRGGTMISASQELEVGTQLDLCLSFPGLLAPIVRRGVVRWVQAEGPGELTAGVEFDLHSAEDWSDLDRLVQRIKRGDRSVVAPLVRILVVEDNAHVARLICDGLTAYGSRVNAPLAFTTRHAGNGKEALDLIAREGFDVLIIDMYLPVMDGGQLIRSIRLDARWRALPIVVVSAGGDEAQQQAREAGADFFLSKPLRLADVLETIQGLLALGGASGDQRSP